VRVAHEHHIGQVAGGSGCRQSLQIWRQVGELNVYRDVRMLLLEHRNRLFVERGAVGVTPHRQLEFGGSVGAAGVS
jgi:hypothetical protein